MPVQIGPVTIGPPDQPSDQTEPDLSKPAAGAAAQTTTAPQLTDAQQAAVDKLVTQYGAQAGVPTPALRKNNLGADVPAADGTLTVTFGRGTQVEVGPNGELGPITHPPAATSTKTATAAAGLERLDANLQPTTDPKQTVYVRDPNAPAGTAPFKVEGGTELGDPSTWTPIKNPNDPTETVGLFDPQSKKVAATVSAAPNAKPSGVYTNITDPNDPAGKRVIGMVDTGDKSVHTVQAAPDGTQIITAPGQGIYKVDKDTGTSTLIQKLDPADVNKQAVPIGGKVYTFDPKDGSFTLPTNVQAAATVGNSTTLKDLVWYDEQGNQTGSTPNPNYGKAPITAPTPNTVAPQIQVPESQVVAGGDPSKLVWVDNKGQVTASDALKQLASHLSGQVVDGKISVDEAKTLIDASNAKMTSDTQQQQNVVTGAGDILANTRGNAQTAAGLLQQRVQAATGTLQNILGNALSNKNITSVPGDVGANLVGGLQGWTADLMGGQSTLDSAARMVQAADPQSNMADPTTQAAVATLHQMLDKYQQVTGVPHPIVQATQAANASQQNGGMAAPNTFNPQASTAALNAGGYQDTPQGRAAAAAAAPGLLATPATQATPATAAAFTAPAYGAGPPPGANYGNGVAYTGGIPPWLAPPQPAFMAPVTG